METSNEIRSAIKNIRYYAEKIKELTKQQQQKDIDIGTIIGMQQDAGSRRFQAIGCISTAVEWIDVYCDNIESNLKGAESEDEKLRLPNEKEAEIADIPGGN